MRISDAQWLPCAPEQTWDALNDPEILRKCIPGCVQIDRRSDTEFWVTLHSKVAGIDANYEGELLLSDIDAPNSCTLAFEGKGNAAGLAIGTAQINLKPANDGTRISYTVAAMAGGKLGELPNSVLLRAGEKIVEKFFTAFMSHACTLPHLVPVEKPETALSGIRNHPAWSWAIAAGVVIVLTGYHHFFVN